MAEQHPRPDVDNPVAGYEAEDTVNLRAQRLRRPESEPDEQPAEDSHADATPDPYGVGQDALAAVETPDVDPAAFYRARLFDRQEEDPTAEPAAGVTGSITVLRAPCRESR